jgi:hypothetical protein
VDCNPEDALAFRGTIGGPPQGAQGVPDEGGGAMVTDYIPTTETVRERYADVYSNFVNGIEHFDRWLAAHDAEVRDAAVAEWAASVKIPIEAEQGEPSEQIKQLLADLIDPDDCWFDHHGGCQAHGYLSLKPGEKCPHAEAKELLASWEPVEENTPHTEGNER